MKPPFHPLDGQPQKPKRKPGKRAAAVAKKAAQKRKEREHFARMTAWMAPGPRAGDHK